MNARLPRRARRTLGLALMMLLLPLLAAASCSSGNEPHAPAPGDPCADGTIALLDGVTDEACRAYLEAPSLEQDADPRSAPRWSTPADGATLPASTAPTFAWTHSVLGVRDPLRALAHELDPLKKAWAHGETTGDVYVLRITDDAKRPLVDVMTTSLHHTPDAATWKKLSAAGRLRATLTWVSFSENRVTNGPVAAAPIALTIDGG